MKSWQPLFAEMENCKRFNRQSCYESLIKLPDTVRIIQKTLVLIALGLSLWKWSPNGSFSANTSWWNSCSFIRTDMDENWPGKLSSSHTRRAYRRRGSTCWESLLRYHLISLCFFSLLTDFILLSPVLVSYLSSSPLHSWEKEKQCYIVYLCA